jgi:DNA-binding beta-propeller fold protein YncE
MSFGTYGSGNGQFNNPIDLVMDSSNNIYVADNSNHRIQVFDSNGNYLTQFGNSGPTGEQLKDPVAVAISSNGDVYVTDGIQSIVHVFSPVR